MLKRSMTILGEDDSMGRNQYVGIIWVVVAILYGVGTGLIQERWFTIGGAAFFAIMAVTIPIWRQWLPDNPGA